MDIKEPFTESQVTKTNNFYFSHNPVSIHLSICFFGSYICAKGADINVGRKRRVTFPQGTQSLG